MNHRALLTLLLVCLMSTSLFALSPASAGDPDGGGSPDIGDSIAGTLQDYTNVSTGLPLRGNYNCIVMGDVNGDGYDDLAASAGKGDNTAWPTYGLFVFTSDKGRSWVNSSTGLPTTGRFGGIDLGDLDGDGDLDLAAGGEGHANSQVKGITIWLNNGTHNGTIDWISGNKPESVRLYEAVIIEDVDDDGNEDIVAATYYDGVRVWLGDGGAGGSLSWTKSNSGLPSTGQYVGVAVADFNNDGNDDIVSTSYFNPDPEVHLFTGDGNGSWTSWDSLMPKPGNYGQAYGVTVGDFDEDGNMDLVYGRKSYGVVCLLGNGGGTNGTDFKWTSGNTGLPSTNHYYGAFVEDLDSDGNLDILLANGFNNQGLKIYLGNGGSGGSMSWTRSPKNLPSDWFFGGAIGDFNNDDVLDVVGSSWDNRTNGGLRAFRGALDGKRAPLAEIVFNGTSSNETTISVGETAGLDGRLSSDVEDAPDGDPTGSLLTYEWEFISVPGGSSITVADLSPSETNATCTFVPDVEGIYILMLSVKDSDDQWSVDLVYATLEVIRTNLLPVAMAGPDIEAFCGDVVKLNGTGSFDPDGEVMAWQWNASTVNPATVLLQNATLPEASFMAPEVTGIYSFIFKVRDDLGVWGLNDTINVTVVRPPNVPPVAVAGADFATRPSEIVSLDASASYDEDGTIVGWLWRCTSHPTLFITGHDTIEAWFTPTIEGTYVFTLSVLDDRGEWSAEDSVNITVLPVAVNVPPVATILGSALREVYVGDAVILNGSGSRDDDGVVSEYLWNCSSHSGIGFTGQSTDAIMFIPDTPGDYVFTLAVRDDKDSWSLQEVEVTIHAIEVPVNSSPVAIISGPVSIMLGEGLALTATSSYDPDGGLVSWRWDIASHPDLELTGDGTSEATFEPSEAGTYTFTLEVQDNLGLWSSVTEWTVTVIAPNLPPVAEVGDHITIRMGQTATLDGSGSNDLEGTIVTWRWTCTSHQDLSGLEPDDTEVAVFSPSAPGTFTFSLEVKDEDGLWSDPAEIIVTVLKDEPPTISIVSPGDGTEVGQPTFTVSGTATDDVAIEKVEISIDGTTWTICSGTASWSAEVTLEVGSNTITARVTDTYGSTHDAVVSVSVETPEPIGSDPSDGSSITWILLVAGVVGGLAVILGFISRKKGDQ